MCMTVPTQAYQAGVEALMNSAQLRVSLPPLTFVFNFLISR